MAEIFRANSRCLYLLIIFTLLFGTAGSSSAQTSMFTYQGRLTDGGTPANGNYDLQFVLFDSLSGGTQIGSTQALNTVSVTGGVFTDRKSTRLNSSHSQISYAVFCLKKKKSARTSS